VGGRDVVLLLYRGTLKIFIPLKKILAYYKIEPVGEKKPIL
jgi:hypothetical protein